MINVPSPAHLSDISSALDPKLFTADSLGSSAQLRGAFLFLGPGVSSSPAFRAYLEELRLAFPDLTLRVSAADFVAQGKNEVTFGPSSLLNLRLQQLDEHMFQLPRYDFLDEAQGSDLALPAGSSALDPNSHFASSLVPLEADKFPFGSGVRNFDFAVPSEQAELEASRLKGPEKPIEVQQRAADAWAAFKEKAQAARESVAQESHERASRAADASAPQSEGSLTVTPLGTGSAIPSKYRNVSGTLLHLPKERLEDPTQYILLDAGEGTWGQLARRFGSTVGRENVDDVLRGLKMIFLSHMHQDHHAGIATILRKRAQVSRVLRNPHKGPRLRSELTAARDSAVGSALHRRSAQRANLSLGATSAIRSRLGL